VTGVLLLLGFWTPIAGGVATILETILAFSRPDGAWESVLAGAIALSLAFLGPGAWSLDSRAYGESELRFAIFNRHAQETAVAM
jgi:putative oxidoreductase